LAQISASLRYEHLPIFILDFTISSLSVAKKKVMVKNVMVETHFKVLHQIINIMTN
jgi:hypothetical protein